MEPITLICISRPIRIYQQQLCTDTRCRLEDLSEAMEDERGKSMTLSHHPSVSSIASRRSSRLHTVSTQSCCILVLSGCPAFARSCEGINWSMSPMSSSLLLQQRSSGLVRLTWIVFVMGGRGGAYSCCLVGFCLQDRFNIARSILV